MPQEYDNIPFSQFNQIMLSEPLFDSAQLSESNHTYNDYNEVDDGQQLHRVRTYNAGQALKEAI